MEYRIKSRKLQKDIIFSRPGSHYVYVDMTGGKEPGTLGKQICKGGYVNSGVCITSPSDDYSEFVRICKNWWTACLHNMNR